MKRFIAGVFGLAFLASLAFAADTGIVRGKVVDEKGQPIPEAQILMESQAGSGQKFSQKANKKGEYIQVGVKTGLWRITASKEGYGGQFAEVSVGIGAEARVPDLKLVAGGGAGKSKGSAELQEAYEKANALVAASDFDGAIAGLNEILAKGPGKPEVVHTRLGQIYLKKNELPAAEEAFKKALELKPGHLDAIRGLSDTYIKMRRASDATALFAQYTSENPEDVEGQFLYGFVLFNTGNQAEAETAFAKVMELDPTNNSVHFYMGMILVGKNKVPEAIASLEKYLASNPTDPTSIETAKGLIAALKPKK